jgi:hypothetical protein
VSYYQYTLDILSLASNHLFSRHNFLLFAFHKCLFFRWEFIFKKGNEFWFRTNYEAKKFRIVMCKLFSSDTRKGEGKEGALLANQHDFIIY